MSSPTARKEIIPLQKFEGHTYGVTGATHLPDGQRMMTCSYDGSLRVWNLESGKQIGKNWGDDSDDSAVCTISLSPDGKKVASGSGDGAVRLWDLDTCKVIVKWTGHTKGISSVRWRRDGRRVVSGSSDGTARQWDVANEKTILRPIETRHQQVYAIVYSPNMTMIATAGCDEFIKIWHAKTLELERTLEGHKHHIECLAWSGNEKLSGSQDSSIRRNMGSDRCARRTHFFRL